MLNNVIGSKSNVHYHWHWPTPNPVLDITKLTPPKESVLALHFLEHEVGVDESSILNMDPSSGTKSLLRLEPKAPFDNTLISINLDDPPPLELAEELESKPCLISRKIICPPSSAKLSHFMESESPNTPILSRNAEEADLFHPFSVNLVRHTLTL